MEVLIFIITANGFLFLIDLMASLTYTIVWLLRFGACISKDRVLHPAVTSPRITGLTQTKMYFLLPEQGVYGALLSGFLPSNGPGVWLFLS